MDWMKILMFLWNHKFQILSLILALVSFIVILCKKNKTIDNNYLAVLSALPDFILEAEALSNKSEKFSYVIGHAITYLCTLTGLSTKEVIDRYSLPLEHDIEKILSTPQKKGVSYEKINEKK